MMNSNINTVADQQLQNVVKMKLLANQHNLNVKDLLETKSSKIEINKSFGVCKMRLFQLLKMCVTKEERIDLLSTLGLTEQSVTALILK
jgi:ERCC4-related helicase